MTSPAHYPRHHHGSERSPRLTTNPEMSAGMRGEERRWGGREGGGGGGTTKSKTANNARDEARPGQEVGGSSE